MATKTAVPRWCKLVRKMPKGASGAKGSAEFEGYDLARELYGPQSDDRNSGLMAFAYLWRRFGPSDHGYDDHKGLASYYIGTPNPGVFLWLGLSASPLPYAVGFVAAPEVRDSIYAPHAAWMVKADQWAIDHGRGSYFNICMSKGFKVDGERVVAEIGECPRPDSSRWRDPSEPCHALNQAIADALGELLRPVYVRDVPVNVLGIMADSDAAAWKPAKPSRYAGLGVPLEAMDALAKAEPRRA